MSYIEQELLDNRRWIDFLDVQPGVVGVHVRVSNQSPLARPNSSLMSAHVIRFLQRAGLRSQFAVPVGVGATAGFIRGDFFQFMKLIGITAQGAKFVLAWQARIARRKRRHLLPEAMVILLADHIEPKQVGPDTWDEMASRFGCGPSGPAGRSGNSVSRL